MDGFINLRKERGMTSFQCVAAVRRITGVKKTGHAGTLDPEAEGVLPICIGQAAKCSEYFLRMRKAYRAEVTFGYCTDTMDIWGTESERFRGDLSYLTEALVADKLRTFTGNIEQVPSMYSAIKKDGVPLYKLARRGEAAEIEPRKVTVYSIGLDSFMPAFESDDGLPKAVISVVCSRGTYIRSICNDLGRLTGCFAVMSALVRTRYGDMSLENSVTLEELKNAAAESRLDGFVLPIDFPMLGFPKVSLSRTEVGRYIAGKPVSVGSTRVVTGSKYENGAGAVYAAGEILLYSGDRLFAVAKAVSVPAENSGAAETETAVHKKGGETEAKIRLMPNKFFGFN